MQKSIITNTLTHHCSASLPSYYFRNFSRNPTGHRPANVNEKISTASTISTPINRLRAEGAQHLCACCVKIIVLKMLRARPDRGFGIPAFSRTQRTQMGAEINSISESHVIHYGADMWKRVFGRNARCDLPFSFCFIHFYRYPNRKILHMNYQFFFSLCNGENILNYNLGWIKNCSQTN